MTGNRHPNEAVLFPIRTPLDEVHQRWHNSKKNEAKPTSENESCARHYGNYLIRKGAQRNMQRTAKEFSSLVCARLCIFSLNKVIFACVGSWFEFSLCVLNGLTALVVNRARIT